MHLLRTFRFFHGSLTVLHRRTEVVSSLPRVLCGWAVMLIFLVHANAVFAGLLEPPSQAKQDATLSNLKEVYGDEYRVTDTKSMHQLVRTLKRGARRTDDLASRFVMLQEVYRLGNAMGDVWTAYEAADALGRQFKIDALAMKQEAIKATERRVRDEESARQMVRLGLGVANQMKLADRYDDALAMLKLLRTTAARTRDRAVIDELSDVTREMTMLRLEYNKVQSELASLSKNPDDPKARLAVGRFEALVKGYWAQGLPKLAESKDPVLADLAKRDLADPDDAAEQVALGDAWMKASESLSSFSQANARQRARQWYMRALPELEGLERRAVAQRARSMNAILSGGKTYEAGLRAEYRDVREDKVVRRQVDSNIDFDWALEPPARKVPKDRFKVVWEGYLLPPEEGWYALQITADDFMRVNLDGRDVLAGTDTAMTTLYLPQTLLPLKVNYSEHSGKAVARLQWRKHKPGADVDEQPPWEPVSADALYHVLIDESAANR